MPMREGVPGGGALIASQGGVVGPDRIDVFCGLSAQGVISNCRAFTSPQKRRIVDVVEALGGHGWQ